MFERHTHAHARTLCRFIKNSMTCRSCLTSEMRCFFSRRPRIAQPTVTITVLMDLGWFNLQKKANYQSIKTKCICQIGGRSFSTAAQR